MVYPILIIAITAAYSLYAAWDRVRHGPHHDEFDVVGDFCLKFWKAFGLFRNH